MVNGGRNKNNVHEAKKITYMEKGLQKKKSNAKNPIPFGAQNEWPTLYPP